MGFFDRKSWQLRRKIKDLQAELKQAERDGRFVREQGLFFAELQEMGEQTIMLMGTVDAHAAQEMKVVETFLDRNGYQLESYKLNREKTGVQEAEIMPPKEMLTHLSQLLEDRGWQVVDDGDAPRELDPIGRQFPLSALIPAVNLLLCRKVRSLVAATRIKKNKEGNLLLQWLPSIIETQEQRAIPQAIEAVQPLFTLAHAYLYEGGADQRKPREKKRKGESTAPGIPPRAEPSRPPEPAKSKSETNPPSAPRMAPAAAPARESVDKLKREMMNEMREELKRAFDQAFGQAALQLSTWMEGRLARLASAASAAAPPPADAPQGSFGVGADGDSSPKLERGDKAARAAAGMYHALVGASPARCVKNSEAVLKFVNWLFDSSATCVLKRSGKDQMTVFAQSGKKLVWGDAGAGGFPISASIVGRCAADRAVTVNAPKTHRDPSESMIQFGIEAAAAAPILVDGELIAVLYADRRETKQQFTAEEAQMLGKVVRVFEEFPDLTLGIG